MSALPFVEHRLPERAGIGGRAIAAVKRAAGAVRRAAFALDVSQVAGEGGVTARSRRGDMDRDDGPSLTGMGAVPGHRGGRAAPSGADGARFQATGTWAPGEPPACQGGQDGQPGLRGQGVLVADRSWPRLEGQLIAHSGAAFPVTRPGAPLSPEHSRPRRRLRPVR